MDSIPGSERSTGRGHGNPLQESGLEKPTDRGAWCATVQRVAKRQTRLKRLSINMLFNGASQVALVVKNLPANSGNAGLDSIPGSGRSLEKEMTTNSSCLDLLSRQLLLLPGQRSLEDCSPRSHKKWDMTKAT